jgi:hypothetical protein
MAVFNRLPAIVAGSDTSLQLNHWRSLTPADCLGHEVTTLPWLQDDFRRNSQRELSCKDTARSNSSAQALVEYIEDVRLRYAESSAASSIASNLQVMQWRKASQVNDWQKVRAVGLCLQIRPDAIRMAPGSLSCNNPVALKNGAGAWRAVFVLNHARP